MTLYKDNDVEKQKEGVYENLNLNVQKENMEAYIARYINSQIMKDEFNVSSNYSIVNRRYFLFIYPTSLFIIYCYLYLYIVYLF